MKKRKQKALVERANLGGGGSDTPLYTAIGLAAGHELPCLWVSLPCFPAMLSSLLFGGEQHCCKPNNSLNRLPTRDNPWVPGSLRDAPGYTHCLLGSNQQKYETVLGQMSICPSL